MLNFKEYPSSDYLQKLFTYRDGVLFHTGARARTVMGAAVGTRCKRGYYTCTIDYVLYQVHRLIYIMHNGSIPEGLVVDHINGNPSDNRIENLQAITQHQNCIKQRLHNPSNKSGYRGVSWFKRDSKWVAAIKHNGISYNLGTYAEAIDAAIAYDEAAKEKFGTYAVLNFPENTLLVA